MASDHRLADGPVHGVLRAHDWSCVAGAMYVYVDLLTNPLAAWALTIAVVGLTAAQSRPAEVLARQIDAAIGWAIGYAGMWLGKWAIAAVVVGPGAMRSDVTSTISLRLSGQHGAVDDAISLVIVLAAILAPTARRAPERAPRGVT